MKYSENSPVPGNPNTARKSPCQPDRQKVELFRVRAASPTVTSVPVASVAAGAIMAAMLRHVPKAIKLAESLLSTVPTFNDDKTIQQSREPCDVSPS